jgi:hypothetical protein
MIRKLLIALCLVFLGMQLIRPAKNQSGGGPSPDDVFSRYAAPAEVRRIVEHACYDCHSNETRYPWYAEVQPGGWLLARHVRDGKRHLNFSEFGKLPATRAKRQLEACVDEITGQTMPLPSYLWIHRDAALSEAEVTAVTAWVEKITDQLRAPEVAGQASRAEALSVSSD